MQQSIAVGNQKQKEQLKILQDSIYSQARGGNIAGAENILTQYEPTLIENYKRLNGDFGYDDFLKGIKQDAKAVIASGLLENNPATAKDFILKNKEAIGAETADKLLDAAGQRIVNLERWNDTKEAIAGDMIFKDVYNRILDGKENVADLYNDIERNDKLSHREKEFLTSQLYKSEQSKKEAKAKITQTDKIRAADDLNNAYLTLLNSDETAVKKNLKDYSSLLRNNALSGTITEAEYRDYDLKAKAVENTIMETNYGKDYDKQRLLWTDYKAVNKVNGYLKEKLNPILGDVKDDKKFQNYVKTNKFAIGYKNTLYKDLNFVMDELIGEEAERKKVDFEQYKQNLSAGKIEEYQDKSLNIIGRKYILQNSSATEEDINKLGVNTLIPQLTQIETLRNNREEIDRLAKEAVLKKLKIKNF
jgi:hypothetical protein